MGPTGAGKSTFINLASNSKLRVGQGLISCTDKIELSREFQVDDVFVTLVDTPGFDDTTKSDIDVLHIICDYLVTQYEQGRLLRGILYLHPISDNKMTGSAIRNLRFFQKLCGSGGLANTIIVTNMWSDVDPAKGAIRERELISSDSLFKPVISLGARMRRHHDTITSAHDIIHSVLQHGKECALRVQEELVELNLPVIQTAAGVALLQELAAHEQQYVHEKEQLEREFAEAMRKKDQQNSKELDEARKNLAVEQQKLDEQMMKLEKMVIIGKPGGNGRKSTQIVNSKHSHQKVGKGRSVKTLISSFFKRGPSKNSKRSRLHLARKNRG